MLHIGITGGIGSGKTTVCSIFEQLGIPIYDSDTEAKKLVAHDLKELISESFGEEIYPKGVLDKQKLASAAFADQKSIDKLNAIVHPEVAKHYNNWQDNQSSPYTLKEAALLIEAGSYQKLDLLIVVVAPTETRINRVMQRNKWSRKEIENRISKQLTDAERLQYADYVIDNSGEQSLIKQVILIHQQLIELENAKK